MKVWDVVEVSTDPYEGYGDVPIATYSTEEAAHRHVDLLLLDRAESPKPFPGLDDDVYDVQEHEVMTEMPELFVWWQAVETVWMNVPMLDVFERQTSTHRHSHVGTSFPEDCTPSVRHGHVQKAPERHWITVRCFGMSREEAAEGASTMMLDEIATYKAKQAKKKAKSFS